MFERFNELLTPDRSAPLWIRLLPYASLIAFGILIFAITGAAWEYTNRSEFCGTACHTMPPEYASYQVSPHSRVNCVECHIGRTLIATQFTRKASDIMHVVRYVGADYEVPIYAKRLRPASQICERCHNPDKFSDDSLREYRHFDATRNNEPRVTYLAFKTGGGTAREGLGKGIHWHIENKVEYISADPSPLEQEIPWVRVTYADTGEVEEYTDIEADYLTDDYISQNEENIKIVDCMNCHNRISHLFPTPSDAIDDAMARGTISPGIPYFKQNAVAVMERQYPSMDEALVALKGLEEYYQTNWPDYYAENGAVVTTAVETLMETYRRMVFPTMDVSWETYPNHLGHDSSPGCFRCHDGKHLNEANESIRIECNLCHTIPLKSRPDGSVPTMPVEEPFEPASHVDTNWISRHRFEFDSTCEGCHNVSDPGGISDTSFCSNSGCHANEWVYAGLDAPGIIELTNVLDEDLPTYPEADLTWNDLIQPILSARCVACHGGTAGLNLDTYQGIMAGGNMGPAITPGNVEESILVQLQRSGHPNSLAPRELEWVEEWIAAGAPQ